MMARQGACCVTSLYGILGVFFSVAATALNSLPAWCFQYTVTDSFAAHNITDSGANGTPRCIVADENPEAACTIDRTSRGKLRNRVVCWSYLDPEKMRPVSGLRTLAIRHPALGRWDASMQLLFCTLQE
jgi:hypothetical protein